MRVAIVVPTLNEEATIARTLPAAQAALAPLAGDELVVSDGGSVDRTVEVARSLGARVVVGPAGRGGQLNRGAAATTAEILLFLHADTTLPAGALSQIRAAIAGGRGDRGGGERCRAVPARAARPVLGGAFLLRFDTDRRLLRLGAWLINQRTRATRLPLGDQAHFLTRAAFDELGGYREWPILEDLDLSWRLRRHGRTVILEQRVTTGARRFVELGVVRTVAINWWIWLLFVAGVSPRRLARLYGEVR
ncbi:MAG TPA: TIGR04283 family arsenosugar biosynthesis glycosyltransferase [Thermoanaerobaculia bacterium]|nr:TIGR04283 family arsenosugar biosynthesis glycosyltransferase [Thermoanaerobaculia bacterium]